MLLTGSFHYPMDPSWADEFYATWPENQDPEGYFYVRFAFNFVAVLHGDDHVLTENGETRKVSELRAGGRIRAVPVSFLGDDKPTVPFHPLRPPGFPAQIVDINTRVLLTMYITDVEAVNPERALLREPLDASSPRSSIVYRILTKEGVVVDPENIEASPVGACFCAVYPKPDCDGVKVTPDSIAVSFTE